MSDWPRDLWTRARDRDETLEGAGKGPSEGEVERLTLGGAVFPAPAHWLHPDAA